MGGLSSIKHRASELLSRHPWDELAPKDTTDKLLLQFMSALGSAPQNNQKQLNTETRPIRLRSYINNTR